MHSPFSLLQAVIFTLFFTILSKPTWAEQGAEQRFATLDWTTAETLIALGEPPIAVGDKLRYRQWVAVPELPNETLDLGVRMQPNPERIAALIQNEPNVHFINSTFYTSVSQVLEKQVPVDLVNFYDEGDAWQNILNATQKTAEIIGKPTAYTTLMKRYWQKMEEIRPLVAPFTDRPIILVQFIDARHLRIYAQNSPFGAALSQLGFENAWQGGHNYWGFEVIELTQLAKLPKNSRFVVVKPYPSDIARTLKYNTLWQKLEMAQDPLVLPAIWTFGGVPSVQRFAETFAHSLQHGGEAW